MESKKPNKMLFMKPELDNCGLVSAKYFINYAQLIEIIVLSMTCDPTIVFIIDNLMMVRLFFFFIYMNFVATLPLPVSINKKH